MTPCTPVKPLLDAEAEMHELLRWVYQTSRIALFERRHRAAGDAALKALSEINHKLGQFRN
jgi:hypothetical protein